ncbi:helix-turn-helix domain-containing protein [Clostridium sp. D33t1_170424_F3]|uniref:response regulator n=1 Tax=Clostridium sp. D33t1_170424_F3 TaxID=2787099 RepID=UPI0018AA70F5|nr:helix-turn-helix domain-containing protein [Clostridium sp. D33t1_170424_F3]
MYKALIADDEDIIRRGIAYFLKKDPEIEVVAQAEDGEMALELAAEHLPDLLFVDINMPFLNGLEFIEKLEGILKNAVIIVITGYDDFKYAQKALRLGVFDYLLKPIMENTFYDAVDRAKEQLGRHKKQVKYLEWARVLVEKNRPALIAEFLEGWLNGHFSETEVEERIAALGLELPKDFGVTLIHLEDKDNAEIGGEWDDDLLFYAAENIAEEVFQVFQPVSACRNAGGDLVLITACTPREEWLAAGERLSRLLQQYLPVDVAIAHKGAEEFSDLPGAYEAAMDEMRALLETPQLVRDVKHYIEENFSMEAFSLTDAADYTHVSPQHLSRVFRQSTGITFMDYITRVRIRKAIELLADEDLKMYEIAERVGYSSQHYFSSAFKKVLGVSPMEYKKGLQKK